MLRRMALASLVVVLCASVLVAQDPPRRGQGRGQGRGQPGMGFGGFGGPLSLLTIDDVKKELKLDEEQIKKIDEFQKKIRDLNSMQGVPREERQQKMQENRAKTQEITKEALTVLKPEQSKRLKQLQYQRDGVMALVNDEEARKSLNLSEEQNGKIKAIQEDMASQQRELRQGGGQGGDFQEMMKKGEEIRKNAATKVEGVLTDEQKAKWKEMQGEPFKGNLRPQMRRPGTVG